jgi:hypothetical protein
VSPKRAVTTIATFVGRLVILPILLVIVLILLAWVCLWDAEVGAFRRHHAARKHGGS